MSDDDPLAGQFASPTSRFGETKLFCIRIADLVDRDPVFAYYVAAYFEVRHAAACRAVQGVVDAVVNVATADLDLEFPSTCVVSDIRHVLNREVSASIDLPRAVAAFVALAAAINPIRELTDNALNRLFATRKEKKPPKEHPETKSDLEPVPVQAPKNEFDRVHPPNGDGLYYARWTSVEDPNLLKGPGWPLYCRKRANRGLPIIGGGGDDPALIELPTETGEETAVKTPYQLGQPYVKNDDGKLIADGWFERVAQKHYPVRRELMTLIETGETTTIYTAILQDQSSTGTITNWEKLRGKLNQAVDDKKAEVGNTIEQSLKGVTLGGIPLGPLAGGVKLASDALTALIHELINWLFDQLEGKKFMLAATRIRV